MINLAKENIQRKEAILQAAVKIFSEKSYNGTSTREIAEKAGVSSGTMFRHFQTKEDILHELMMEIVQNIVPKLAVESIETVITEYIGQTPEETLKALVGSRIRIISDNFEIFKVIITEGFYNAEVRETFLQHVYFPIRKLLINFINNGIQNGYFRKIDPDGIVRFFTGSLIAIVIESKYLEQDDLESKLEQIKDQLIDLLFYGISAKNNLNI